MTVHRLEEIPKIRMVGPTASKFETGPPPPLYDVSDFFFLCTPPAATRATGCCRVHERSGRTISRTPSLYTPVVRDIVRTRAAITGWGEERYTVSKSHRCRHHRFFLPLQNAGRSIRIASPLLASARPLNDETLRNVPRSLFLNLLKDKLRSKKKKGRSPILCASQCFSTRTERCFFRSISTKYDQRVSILFGCNKITIFKLFLII